MRRGVLLLGLLAAACARRAPAAPPAEVDASAPVAEVVVPEPVEAVGDVRTTRAEVVAAGTMRLYRDGKWVGNGSAAWSLEVESRREVLAVQAGRASRLRLEYPAYRHTLRVGGEERDLAPRLAGRSFICDLAGGLSVVAGDGAALAPEELAVLRREVEDAAMWAPVQGRTLVLGQAIAGPAPWGGRFMLKDRRGDTALLAARLTLDAAREGLVVDGEAVLDLVSGRVTRFAGDGMMKLGAAGERGRRGVTELVGDARVRVVLEVH